MWLESGTATLDRRRRSAGIQNSCSTHRLVFNTFTYDIISPSLNHDDALKKSTGEFYKGFLIGLVLMVESRFI